MHLMAFEPFFLVYNFFLQTKLLLCSFSSLQNGSENGSKEALWAHTIACFCLLKILRQTDYYTFNGGGHLTYFEQMHLTWFCPPMN